MNISHSVLCRIVGNALKNNSLDWRHHGVGMYQAYLHEGDEEVRVHIWHPDLILPGFNENNGIMHDHRFGFTSYVLLGAIFNEVWDGEIDPGGDWVHYACINAREAKERGGTYHEPLGRADGNFWSYRREGQWYNAGTHYRFEPRIFHYSKAQGLTITLVVKTHVVDGYARILARRDVPLVHAFEHGNDVRPEYVKLAASMLL